VVDFQFRPVNARPFVTVDVRLTGGDEDPTGTVIRAIARKDIQDAVVRIRIALPAELEAHLRESDIRQALAEAHYIAAVSQQTEDARRTRLGTEVIEGLQPMQALRLYLDGRTVEPNRQEKILRYAEELAEMDADTS
jgi:exonuclease SbcD